jgi:tetratricopeptide (TPR) repeat protein
LNEHPSRAEISALLEGDFTPHRRIEIFLHLLRPCEECLAQAAPQIRVLLGFEDESAAADQEAAIDRAFQVARRHARHLEQQRNEAKKAEEILAQGGLEAAENLPVEIGNLAAMEALLTRSWAARHEDPNLMFQLAFLATKRAEKLDAWQYGIQRVYDFRCRAEAELGNAYRVIDQFGAARKALGTARGFFELGTRSESLDVRLLSFEASLDADLRDFNSACVRLTKAYKVYLKIGEQHLAGRMLVKKGLFTSDAGRDVEALEILKKSLKLIDPHKDPALAFAANLNILLILVGLGTFDEARKQLFYLRPLQPYAGGRLNELRLHWLEGRIDASSGKLSRAEKIFREIRIKFSELNRANDSALVALDLTAVLLAQKKAREATEVVTAAYKIFLALGIQREALLTLSFLCNACEVRMATPELVEDVARFMRRLQVDPKARFEGRR